MTDVTNTPLAESVAGWSLQVSRADLSRTRVVETHPVPLQDGEVRIRVDRVGLTANNVTYAVLGTSFRYWEFFPAEDGWGIVPVWGFGDVVETTVDGVEIGSRYYGYWPSASHLVVRPGRVDRRGFRDVMPHRVELPSPYNAYSLTDNDPAYSSDTEDLEVLYRPLYWTSYMFADWLVDNDCFGAQVVVMSSASSKTAYGAAFELHRLGRTVIGLTSAGNVDFTEGLGCYDHVLTYDQLDRLPVDAAVLYADFAGRPGLSAALRSQVGERLVHEVVVGVTNQQSDEIGTVDDTGPEMFFAPDQMRKRFNDWGREGVDRNFGESWRDFVVAVKAWVDVVPGRGVDHLEGVWRQVQSGRSDPRDGNVISF